MKIRKKVRLNGQFYRIAREPQWKRYKKGETRRIEMNTKLVALIVQSQRDGTLLRTECRHSFGFMPTKPESVIVQKWGRVCGYCRLRRWYRKMEKDEAWVARRAFLREVLDQPRGEWP